MPTLIVSNGWQSELPGLAKKAPLAELSAVRVAEAVRKVLSRQYGLKSISVSAVARFVEHHWQGTCRINHVTFTYCVSALDRAADESLRCADYNKLLRDMPIACPVCWDHAVRIVKGVELIAIRIKPYRPVGPVVIFHCSSWHLFAVFQCPAHRFEILEAIERAPATK